MAAFPRTQFRTIEDFYAVPQSWEAWRLPIAGRAPTVDTNGVINGVPTRDTAGWDVIANNNVAGTFGWGDAAIWWTPAMDISGAPLTLSAGQLVQVDALVVGVPDAVRNQAIMIGLSAAPINATNIISLGGMLQNVAAPQSRLRSSYHLGGVTTSANSAAGNFDRSLASSQIGPIGTTTWSTYQISSTSTLQLGTTLIQRVTTFDLALNTPLFVGFGYQYNAPAASTFQTRAYCRFTRLSSGINPS